MTKTKEKKLTAGATVRTNDKFARHFPQMTVWHGTLLRPHATIDGSWHVQMTAPAGLPPQVIHSKFLEVQS